jgi:hypothetical protein
MESTQLKSDEEIIYRWNTSSSPDVASQSLEIELSALHAIISNYRKQGVTVKRYRRKRRNYDRLKGYSDELQDTN